MHTKMRLAFHPLAHALALLTFVFPACSGSSGPSDPTPTRPLTYAALGASDAVGIGAVPITSGYVYVLRDKMTTGGFTVNLRNFGIIGAEADVIAARELQEAIAADPQVVTLWTGGNDVVGGRSPGIFAGQLDGILREMRGRTRAQVFVGELPDLTAAPRFRENPSPDVTPARLAAFNEVIRAATAAHGCVLVPTSSLSVKPEMYAGDGFHPSTLGHQRIAELFWREIKSRI